MSADAAPSAPRGASGSPPPPPAAPDDAALAGDAATDEAVSACADLTARAASNFYFAFLPLPRARREGIFAVYAFCRRVDDLVDEPQPGREPARELDAWRARVDAIVAFEEPAAADPEDAAIARALAATHRRFTLRADDLHAVIDGCAMDLEGTHYETKDDLALYCERVAGRVGCLCLAVFGADVTACRPHALALGHAFQLTNILRDVPRDAREGRIYLPVEHRRLFSVSDEELAAHEPTRAALALLRFEAERALELFDLAEALQPRGQERALFSARMMTAIYRRLLESLRDDPETGWRRRLSLPSRVKVLLASGAWLRDRVLRLS